MKIVSQFSEKINWFPGHMRKALRVMSQNTQNVDIFLEIRDARLPYSSKNPEFDAIIKASRKDKVIIFNKMDLCEMEKTNRVIKDYNEHGMTCFGVSTKTHDHMRQIIMILKEKYKTKYKQVGLWFMAFGMPNVGKSSILNQLRNISDLENKRSASKVTASVCTTKGTKGFKILQNPLMFLMDSPGVAVPSVIPNDVGLKMALLGIIKPEVVDRRCVLEFMVSEFQRNQNEKYWQSLRLEKPKDFDDYFQSVRNKYKIHDYDAACDFVLEKFRQGDLGPFTLDDPIDPEVATQ